MNYTKFPLINVFGWGRFPKGEIGIEVEVEGGPFPAGTANNWAVHEDGSLRGGTEYVINRPVKRENVLTSLVTLQEFLGDTPLVFSYRTSVHVHVNVQDLTIAQWLSFISAFAIMEEALVDVVGPKRAGNKFCLRIIDADEPIEMLRRGLKAKSITDYMGNDVKYASMNIQATRTHGTLEFRAMEGNLDPARINDWAQLLLAIKDYAIKIDSPRDIIQAMSNMGPALWASEILPDDNQITTEFFAQDNLVEKLYEGSRAIQMLAYSPAFIEEEVAPPKHEQAPILGEWGAPPARGFDPGAWGILARDIEAAPPAPRRPRVRARDIEAAPPAPRRPRVRARAQPAIVNPFDQEL